MSAAENKAVFLSYASPAFAKASAGRQDFLRKEELSRE